MMMTTPDTGQHDKLWLLTLLHFKVYSGATF